MDGIDYEDFSTVQWLLKLITDPWKNYLLPADWLRAIARSSKSLLIAETFRSPGSWKSMELVYQNASPVDLLDRMAIRDNPISMAARNRRQFVVKKLTELILRYADADVVNVLGVGAGPGLQVQDAFQRTKQPSSKLNAIFVDLDASAFRYGQDKADQSGLGSCVTYIQGDAQRLQELIPYSRFHIAKLVGIIEYLSDDAVVELMTAIRETLHPQGTLLTHGIQDPNRAMPFLERVFGLKHVRRTAEDVQQLLCTAGFNTVSINHLPLGVYSMLAARPRALPSRSKSLGQLA